MMATEVAVVQDEDVLVAEVEALVVVVPVPVVVALDVAVVLTVPEIGVWLEGQVGVGTVE